MNEVARTFSSLGWEEILIPPDRIISSAFAIFKSDYAAIGVLRADNVQELAESWKSCQVELADLIHEKVVPGELDYYLLLIVPKVESHELSALQRALDDTHIARKICLEQGNRTLRDALLDTPFFRWEDPSEMPIHDELSELSAGGLAISAEVLEDLARRSPTVILGRLREGKYPSVDQEKGRER